MKSLRLNASDYKLIFGYFLLATIFLIINYNIEGHSLIEFVIDIPVAIIRVMLSLLLFKKVMELYLQKRLPILVIILLGYLGLWILGFLATLSGDFSELGYIPWDSYKELSVSELLIFNIESSLYNIAIPLVMITTKKFYEYQLEKVEFSVIQKELELKALRSQFDPHFLFNSLNSIDALIDLHPPEKVKTYVSNLAGFYRHLIQTNKEDVMPLSSEMGIANKYIYLIKSRFESDYEFEIDINEKDKDKLIPTGSLLTALENIVKHNEAIDNKSIQTKIYTENDHLIIRNTKLASTEKKESFGQGLKNMRAMYELLSNKEIRVETTVNEFILTLPFINAVD